MRIPAKLLLVACLTGSWGVAAPVFNQIFQNQMVIQRQAPAPIWGKTKPGDKVTVSWKGQTQSTRADAQGNWEVLFQAGEADSQGSTITAQDSDGSTSLENILVGDIWLAGGQSNMEWKVRQSQPGDSGAIDWNRPDVRLLQVDYPLKTNSGAYSVEDYRRSRDKGFFTWTWKPCTSQHVQDFSAVAAYFATRVSQEAGVPIGIICNAIGGSEMEAWIPANVINRDAAFRAYRGEGWLEAPNIDTWNKERYKENLELVVAGGEKAPGHAFRPGFSYQHAVAPLSRLAIKGVIWYQGEANAVTPDEERNELTLTRLIQSWREAFRNPELPFLMVQLPRMDEPSRPYWGAFRTAQQRVADALPGVELICTTDLGTTDRNIHPPVKEPVGFRLADMALHCVYGKAERPAYPRVSGAKTSRGEVTISFDQPLKTTDGEEPRGFEVGDRRYGRFVPAKARLQGDKVTLSFESYAPAREGVANLVWRYNDATALEPNLVGKASGLPAFPHRSYSGAIADKAVPLGKYPAVGKVRIACVGDSITYGSGITVDEERYPEKLGVMLGKAFEVGRFGNPGKTAGNVDESRKRWYGHQKEYTESLAFKADVYICNLGINDTGAWWNPEASERDYQTLIDHFRGEQGATVVLWGKLSPDFRGPKGVKTFPGNIFPGYQFREKDNGSSAHRPEMEAIIGRLAKKNDCPLIDMYTPLCKDPELYKVDGLHPTPEGATKVATVTYNWLARRYKLPPRKYQRSGQRSGK